VRVSAAADGRGMQEILATEVVDLIVLDLKLKTEDGMNVARRLREDSAIPIIMLTGRTDEADRVMGLELGADDYITKPFSIQELLARVRVHSRRLAVNEEVKESLIEVGDFRIDVERHQVMVRGVEVHLTPKEFDLMLHFVRNADRVLTHKTLLRAVWGAAGADQPEYLRVLIAQLRRKVEPGGEPVYILSEPWVGYRLSPRPAVHEAGEGRAPLTDS
jgi:two-component system KDP operon response regulator KdpE